MMAYDNLQHLRDELVKCMKCGNCMASCPVYLTEKTEAGVTRGKISLVEAVLAGTLDIADPQVEEKLFDCLVCGSCMQNCPCGVNFSKIMLAVRAALVRQEGLHPVKKIIFGGLKNQKVFAAFVSAAAAFQWLGLKKTPALKISLPGFPLDSAQSGFSPVLLMRVFVRRFRQSSSRKGMPVELRWLILPAVP